jgi:hypothetical protein
LHMGTVSTDVQCRNSGDLDSAGRRVEVDGILTAVMQPGKSRVVVAIQCGDSGAGATIVWRVMR